MNGNWKKRIALYFCSQSITIFGSQLVQFAIIWYVARVTTSGVMVAISTLCSFLPQIAITLFAGVWADRYNRKFIIIVSDAAIAIATLVLALIMRSGNDSLIPLLIISAIRSLGSGIQTPAVNAVIPQMVPEEQLVKVSGINSTMHAVISLLAPAVSGAILNSSAIYNIMLIDVITAIIGISLLLLIPINSHKQDSNDYDLAGYFTEVKEGLQFSFGNKLIRRMLVIYTIYTVLIVPAGFLNVLMVVRKFGDSYLYLTFNEIAFFIGSALGGISLSLWGGFKNRFQTLSMGLFIFGISSCVMASLNVFWFYLISMILVGFSIPFGGSIITVFFQENVEADLQGRIFSIVQLIFSTFMPLGMIIFGPLADMISIQWLTMGAGIAICILAVFVYFNMNINVSDIKE